jgi:hypothetical protein
MNILTETLKNFFCKELSSQPLLCLQVSTALIDCRKYKNKKVRNLNVFLKAILGSYGPFCNPFQV